MLANEIVEIVVRSMEETKEMVVDFEIESYKEYIEIVYDGDSKQLKEDVWYTLQNACVDVTDEFEIVADDMEITYRKLMNMVKKEMF